MRNVIEALLCIIDIVHDTAYSLFYLQQILKTQFRSFLHYGSNLKA